MFKSFASLAAALCLSGFAAAQTGPTFDVATVKPAAPLNPAQFAAGKLHVGMKIDAARVDIGFMSLSDLICKAYDVKPYQVSGPDWMKSERFDILAKMPEGSTKEQVPEMLKALLVERFGLSVHKDSKQTSVYALVVGKGGSKLKDAEPDPAPAKDDAAPTPAPKGTTTLNTMDGEVRIKPNSDGKGAVISSAKTGNTKMSMGPDGMMHMEMSRMNMANFAETLTPFVDKPVIDRTDLKGNYQVSLDLSMADMLKVARASGALGGAGGPALPAGPAEAASDPAGSSIFNAVQQLGLKLDPRKDTVETIIVDHLEKVPTGN